MSKIIPNELIAELAKFIPYKSKYEEDGEEFYDYLDHPKEGPLLSSTGLSIPNAKLLRKVKEKRYNKCIELAEEMRKLLSGKMKFRQAFDNTRHRYYLLCELGWYFSLPAKNEITLCSICFEWGIYDPNEFVICNKTKAHTQHKKCLKSFPHCLICSPLYDQH